MQLGFKKEIKKSKSFRAQCIKFHTLQNNFFPLFESHIYSLGGDTSFFPLENQYDELLEQNLYFPGIHQTPSQYLYILASQLPWKILLAEK